MADRITQMQNIVRDLRKHMLDSVGVMHESAFNPETTPEQMTKLHQHFTHLISQTAKDLNLFTTYLPELNTPASVHLEDFNTRHAASDAATVQLEVSVAKAKDKLELIRAAIQDLSEAFFLDASDDADADTMATDEDLRL